MRLRAIAFTAIVTCFTSNACRADLTAYAMGSVGTEFGTLDLTTGAYTALGPATTGFYGDITTQPSTGAVYAIDHLSDLVILDPSTGGIQATVGPLSTHFYGLKFGPDGVLYGYGGGSLYTVNLSTASATLIGSYGIDTDRNYGGTFVGNIFYLEANNLSNPNSSSLYTVNLSTGAATFVGDVGYDITTMIYEGSTLYGFTTDASSKVISINTLTGTGTFLYNASGAGEITSLTNISVASVPEPSTVVLAAIACVTGVTAYAWRLRPAKVT